MFRMTLVKMKSSVMSKSSQRLKVLICSSMQSSEKEKYVHIIYRCGVGVLVRVCGKKFVFLKFLVDIVTRI